MPARSLPRLRTAATTVVAAVALGGALAGCGGGDSIAAQARAGDGKGYVAGDGTIKTYPKADREPVAVAGKSLEGNPLDTASLKGSVVVVNVWGSWCGPCTDEAPGLQKAYVELAPKKVRFVGVDIREGAETGLAFQRRAGITYPSISDQGMQALLALRGKATTTPSTLVLDPSGRLAARVAGPVDTSTLTGLVDDVLAEGA